MRMLLAPGWASPEAVAQNDLGRGCLDRYLVQNRAEIIYSLEAPSSATTHNRTSLSVFATRERCICWHDMFNKVRRFLLYVNGYHLER